MFITHSFEQQIMREIDSISALNKIKAVNLGGIAGPSGGGGTPPGGFIGQLPQKFVTYDTTESTDSTPGNSLVQNLNRIRGGWALGDGSITTRHLASGISIPTESTIIVEDNDTSTSYPDISTIQFTNALVSQPSAGVINVSIVDNTPISSGIGYSTHRWYINGPLSLLSGADGVMQFNQPFILRSITMACEITGDSDTYMNLEMSYDNSTWTDVFTDTFPFLASGEFYSTYDTSVVLASGVFIKNKIDSVGGHENLTISLNGSNVSSGGELPVFSPEKVIITDQSGTLSEDDKFVFMSNGVDRGLVIGHSDVVENAFNLPTAFSGTSVQIVRDNVDGGLVLATIGYPYTPNITTYGARGTIDNLEPTQEGDVILRFTARGRGDTEFSTTPRGRLQFEASEDWTDSAQGTRFRLYTTPAGTTNVVDRLTLDDDGTLTIPERILTGYIYSPDALIGRLYLSENTMNVNPAGISNSPLIMVGDDNSLTGTTGAQIFNFSDTHVPYISFARARGSKESPMPTLADNVLGRISGRGYWGGASNDLSQSARASMNFIANEDFTETAQGSRIEFNTTADGETTSAKALTIHADGTTEVRDLRVAHSPTVGQILAASTVDGDLEFIDPPTSGTVVDATYVLTSPNNDISSGVIRPELKNYNPDSIPTSPSVYDDEFSDGTLDTKWVIASNTGTFNLIQTDRSRHISESMFRGYVALQGDWSYTGTDFYQEFIPAEDDWTLVSKILPGYTFTDDAMTVFGISGADNSNYYQVRLGTMGFQGIRVTFNDGTGDYEAVNVPFPITNGVYVLITKREDVLWGYALYSVFASTNGVNWIPIDVERQMPNLMTSDLTTQYFGLNNTTNEPIASIDFIRYFPVGMKFEIGANV